MKAAEFKKLGDYVKIKTGKLDAMQVLMMENIHFSHVRLNH